MPAGKRKREDSGAASKGAPKLKEDGERSSALMAEAAQYLHAWAKRDSGSEWKFRKATQAFILGAMWRSDVICKADFVIALQYLQGLQGVGRDRLRQQAARVMKQCDLPSSEQSDSALAAKVTRNKLKRAVMVLDMLK